MSDRVMGRRSMLKAVIAGAVAVPVSELWSVSASAAATTAAAPAPGAPAAAAPLVPLKPDDPTGKALGYTDDSSKVDAKANPTHKPDQSCSTCVQFKGKPTDARAGCNIYPGKSVSAKGWCKVWAQKPKAS